jgi:hypothetical protein
MRPQLIMAVVMEAFNGCLLDCTVHSLDLTIGPGVIGFRQAMLDAEISQKGCTSG